MWRALISIALLALAAWAAVWLANHPGDILVTWGGREIRTSVAVGLVAVVGVAVGLSLLVTAVRFLLHLPSRVNHASRSRRRARGYQAVSRGMVAVGAGDPLAAKRYAGEAERLLGREPLTLLLKAQAAQVSGDRSAADTAFRRLMDESETRVLGLRGLFVEARRRGDMEAARGYAAEAARLAPAATWANEAVLEAQCSDGDWRGAMATIERRASLGLVDTGTGRRYRAVLLAADAMARAETDPDSALTSAVEATKLAPDLVPAAALAGRLLSRRGDLRRAAKIIETAWKAQPHPDLAAVYLDLRPGDSAQDRLHRAETLARLSSWDPEARLALARAALDARDFKRARSVVQPLLAERPTMRVCLLMADLEQAEHGATGKVREWLARAARAPRDPVWIADGMVSDRWAPISPVTGRIDAFRWEAPPDMLASPQATIEDDVLADLDPQDDAAAPPALGGPTAAAAQSSPASESRISESRASESVAAGRDAGGRESPPLESSSPVPGGPAAPAAAPPAAAGDARTVVRDGAGASDARPAAAPDPVTVPASPSGIRPETRSEGAVGAERPETVPAKPDGAIATTLQPNSEAARATEPSPAGPGSDDQGKPTRFRLFG